MNNYSCNNCKKTFKAKKNRKFCSRKCAGEAHSERMKGSGNSNYKGIDNYRYNCEVCGKEFISYSRTAKFCSQSCNGKRKENIERLNKLAPIIALLPRKKRVSLGIKCECKACGIEFRSKCKSSYCDDHKGYRLGKPKVLPVCYVCGAVFDYPTKNKRKTCSEKCKSDAMSDRQRGSKSHLWDGGKTSESMKIRNSKEYKDWRTKVFNRDNYTCVECGTKGGKLNADHIKPFSTYPDERLNVNNGRTLCLECHLKTDTFGSRMIHKQKARKQERF